MSADSHSNAPGEGGPDAIGQWLIAVGLGQYAEAFTANAVTVEMLPSLTDDDLKECGVSALGHRKIILNKIQQETGAGGPRVVSAAHTVTAPAVPAPEAPPVSTVPHRVAAPRMATAVAVAPEPRVAPKSIAIPPPSPAGSRKVHGKWWHRFANSRFLFISVIVHLLFGLVATYLVVQTITAKRKLTFTAAPPSPNPSQRAVEHQVRMAKKQRTTSAPVRAKRIATTGASKVVLPDLPSMPAMAAMAPGKMAGMGGTGLGLGPSVLGGGSSGGGGGGPVFSVFGARDSRSNALVGQYYDLKRSRGRVLNGMTNDRYADELIKFVQGGWNESHFAKYFKGPRKLYATQFFFPRIDSHEGPRAFGSDLAEPPGLWVAHYKGQVSSPESGVFHFVAAGDDVMYIKFNGRLVLDQCLFNRPVVKPVDTYHFPAFHYVNNGFAKSLACTVKAGEFYDMEVLIGDQTPVDMWAYILLEKNGATYKTDSGGAPILPVFRLSNTKPKTPASGEDTPAYSDDGPIWQGRVPGPK